MRFHINSTRHKSIPLQIPVFQSRFSCSPELCFHQIGQEAVMPTGPLKSPMKYHLKFLCSNTGPGSLSLSTAYLLRIPLLTFSGSGNRKFDRSLFHSRSMRLNNRKCIFSASSFCVMWFPLHKSEIRCPGVPNECHKQLGSKLPLYRMIAKMQFPNVNFIKIANLAKFRELHFFVDLGSSSMDST